MTGNESKRKVAGNRWQVRVMAGNKSVDDCTMAGEDKSR
jgi:hypothetical protein